MTTETNRHPALRRYRRVLGLAITASGLALLATGAIPVQLLS